MTAATRTDPNGFVPMNPRAFAILLVLSENAAHGYRIKQEVEARSHGQILLDPGSLYRTIAKLVRDDLVEEQDAPAGADRDDARRRYYNLTQLGTEVARAETARLASLVKTKPARALLKES